MVEPNERRASGDGGCGTREDTATAAAEDGTAAGEAARGGDGAVRGEGGGPAPYPAADGAATTPSRSLMTRPLLVLFAVAAGAAVGSLYYAQPLLDVIGGDFGAGDGTVGLLVTATQVGYALGILFIVPLGDLRQRRVLIPVMMVLSALALGACAVAPDIATLAGALIAVGVTTVAGQILTPLAGDLADDASRGKVVGIVVSGILTGILIARIFAGLVASAFGWRVVFLVAAVVAVVLAALLYRSIPKLPPRSTTLSYRALLKSVFSLVATEPKLRISMVFGIFGFGVFTMLWTSLTFLLSGPPYNYPTAAIGFFGVAGLIGALAAQGAGRLHDRGSSVAGVGLAWALILVSWVVVGFGGHVLVVLVIGIITLDIGIQGQNILAQSRVFQISAEARSRLNTAYIAGNFIGGAIGSVVATTVWDAGGWPAVSVTGGALSLAALIVWAATRRGALQP
ncbi:MFS transporter [Streptomyces sp. 8L]|uniref:MFS transporter n=2 Tax=unclassified Streptomyces TaxID=2593676 RepID=UPI001CD4D5A7|nr:MFS transporter [Streptomyces sp. 8L]MCA1223304.1 MFS transporter [Streptomyces sp. 8L]